MRDVRRLEGGDLLRCEAQRQCRDRIRQVVWLGRTDDRCGNSLLLDYPGQGHLRPRDASRLGYCRDLVYDLPVGFRKFGIDGVTGRLAL